MSVRTLNRRDIAELLSAKLKEPTPNAYAAGKSPGFPPAPQPLAMLKRPQVQAVVVGMELACAPPQFRLQLMSYTASVQISLQRSSTPFNGPRTQFLVGEHFCFDHGADCGELRLGFCLM